MGRREETKIFRYLVELLVFTFVIHLIDTLSYSLRLSMLRTHQFALTISLFNAFALVSRTANTLQGPLIGLLVGESIARQYDPVWSIRAILLAATLGTLAAVVLIPTFLSVFTKAVAKLELTGSVPALFVQALSVSNLKRIRKSAVSPRREMVWHLRFKGIPKRLILLHVLITGIYTVGVLAAYYSATLVPPSKQLAASASSGLINGVASIVLTLFVDPFAAIITDQAYRGERPETDLKALVVVLIGGKLLGTLLAQLLLVPSAWAIAWWYR